MEMTIEESAKILADERRRKLKEFNYKLPENRVPEFAFVGRSNVGKSSLVGALLGDNTLVRISKVPGCTRTVNYFGFMQKGNSAAAYLVDLPGYGFAR
jgi:GTP-binding protein